MTETTVSVGELSVNDAGSGDVEILDNESGTGMIVNPLHLIAALRGYMTAAHDAIPLATLGNGEYAHHIGE